MSHISNEIEQLTVLQQQEKRGLLAQTAFRTQVKDHLSVLVNNIKIYCSLLIEDGSDQVQILEFRYLLQNQLSDVSFQEPVKDFRNLIQNGNQNIQNYPLCKNLTYFEQTCRQLIKMKMQAQNQEGFEKAQSIILELFKQIQKIIQIPQETIAKFNEYDVYGNYSEQEDITEEQNIADERSISEQEGISEEKGISREEDISEQQGISRECTTEYKCISIKKGISGDEEISKQEEETVLPCGHFKKQLVNTLINFDQSVFSWVKPSLHRVYISQTLKAYDQVAPIRIKSIVPNCPESPVISVNNYFSEGIQQGKAVMAYCIPGTKIVGFYSISDICKLLSMDKQYYQERTLANQWLFSSYTRSLTTPQGKIFAINCKTTKHKIDPSMYQITDLKASNRGLLPNPKRQSSFIYLNGCLYVVGGCGQGQKCSNKNYKYNLKDKKWSSITDSNVALKRPTLCTLNDRYLMKIGGLNEFNYINKVIQIYDPLSDKWSLVRANVKNILEEVEILEDSLAVQINDDQVYVFGGKNSNKYGTDKGFILQINQIKERRKGAAKVNAELWDVSVGKRNILTYFGAYSPSNVLVHFKCIYFLRVKYTQALSI